MPKVASLAIVVSLLAVGGLAPGPAVAANAKRCRAPSHAKVLATSRRLLATGTAAWSSPISSACAPTGVGRTSFPSLSLDPS